MEQNELTTRFTYHGPKADQVPKYEAIRAKAREFAELVSELTPDSREQSLAITAIEDASMWANAAIARRS